jgi:hypothetical protein
METCSSRFRRGSAFLLLLAVALTGGQAWAGMLPMADSIADFMFEDGELSYTPTLEQDHLRLTADNSVLLSPGDGTDRAADDGAGVEAQLRLRANVRNGELINGSFNIFGSMTPAADSDLRNLIDGTLHAMEVSRNGDAFDFMFVGKPLNGNLGLKYRKVGLYVRVAGIDEVAWTRGFDSSASMMNLISGDAAALADAAGDPNQSAVPAPATGLLLALGALPLLVSRRRSRRS